jgi:PAS domain S-box-containing protein
MLQLLVKKRTRELAERNEMLRLAQEGLEERVAQRTSELTNANAALHTEITERNQAEEALRKSEARYRSYIEVTEQLGWTTNADGEVVEDIPSWRRFTGQSEEEVKSWGWSKALHPDDLEQTARVWRNAVATRNNYETEYRIRRYDGVYRHFLAHGVPVFKADGNIQEWVGTCIDITERKRTEQALQRHSLELQRLNETLEQRVQERTKELEKANEELRRLSSKLLSSQEEERRRIAGEIHDNLGACLNAIRFKVEGSLQTIETEFGGQASEPFKSVVPLVQEGIEECRRMQQDLRPSLLDDLGLLPTLSWFCRRFQTIYSTIRIEQEIDIGEDELPNALKIIIYRVLQEAMNNIAKHGRAELVHLSLRKVDGRMELTVRDNGQGFDLEKVSSQEATKKGLGLTSMRERVEFSGGSFTIESGENKGTIIRVSWALGKSF